MSGFTHKKSITITARGDAQERRARYHRPKKERWLHGQRCQTPQAPVRIATAPPGRVAPSFVKVRFKCHLWMSTCLVRLGASPSEASEMAHAWRSRQLTALSWFAIRWTAQDPLSAIRRRHGTLFSSTRRREYLTHTARNSGNRHTHMAPESRRGHGQSAAPCPRGLRCSFASLEFACVPIRPLSGRS